MHRTWLAVHTDLSFCTLFHMTYVNLPAGRGKNVFFSWKCICVCLFHRLASSLQLHMAHQCGLEVTSYDQLDAQSFNNLVKRVRYT